MHSSSFHILNHTLGVGIPSHQDDIIYMLRFGHKHHSRLLSCDDTPARTHTHTHTNYTHSTLAHVINTTENERLEPKHGGMEDNFPFSKG